MCETPKEMLSSSLFLQVLKQCITDLSRRNSPLLRIFEDPQAIGAEDIHLLVETLIFLTKLSGDNVIRVVSGSEQFFRDRSLFNGFVEFIYNYWRATQRLVICDLQDDELDRRPYRTFTNTVESLTHLVRGVYRDIQENITGNHPRIYRQVRAGAEIGTIAMPVEIPISRRDLLQAERHLRHPPGDHLSAAHFQPADEQALRQF